VIFSYTYIIGIDGSKFTCTTCIVYQFFKELFFFNFCFVSKAGCKGKGFILNCQMFWEVFFFNARLLFPSLSVRKGKKRQPKALALRIGLQR
ncbi:hypothetical protein J8L09_17240, partial [Bacteroides fragilis]|uniref:hypothetical protein n=1 Tax=Bacteroides fragilis TaxID=817 RepID=UPI00254641AC